MNSRTERPKTFVMVTKWSFKSNDPETDYTSDVTFLGNIYADDQMRRGNVFNELILLVLCLKLQGLGDAVLFARLENPNAVQDS